jgi:hypothetical protein
MRKNAWHNSSGKRCRKIPEYVASVLLAILIILFSGCGSSTITVLKPECTPSVQEAINVEPASGKYLTSGILIENTSVIKDVLYRDAENGWRPERYHTGDPCYIVSGTMINDTDTDWQVSFHAEGYDSNGNIIARTLDVEPGPLAGIIALTIPAHTTNNFTIHINWAENLTRIIISGHTYSTETTLA